jgi:hypothetical protein
MTELPKNCGIRMTLPSDWIDQTVYAYKGPDEGGVQHNLVVMIDSELETKDLQLYAKQRMQALQDTLQGFELLAERDRTLGSGLAAREAIFKWIPSEGKVIFQKQVYIIAGDRAYNFTASFSKQTLKTIGNDVDAMIDSFIPG